MLQPAPKSPKELTAALKSRENRLALQAVALIRAAGNPLELQEMIHNGLPHNYYERDPSHPRSRYYARMVLDTCFESAFGVTETKEETTPEGLKIASATIGHTHQSEGRLPHFKILLAAGFPPGSNNYRGELFSHILHSCFYQNPKVPTARGFAQALIEGNHINIQHYAKNNYPWTGSLEKLQTILDLGADPTGPDMIDCALRYCGCSPNSGDPESGRADVIKKLIALGATPTEKISQEPWDKHRRDTLEKAGLPTLITA